MPPNADRFSYQGRISTRFTNTPMGTTNAVVRAPNFRDSLRKRSIYINFTNASNELAEEAKKIIETKRSTPEIDDAIVQGLAVMERHLETGTVMDLVDILGAGLIHAIREFSHEYLMKSKDRLWHDAVTVPLGPGVIPPQPPLPKPKPDLVDSFSGRPVGT